MLSAEANYLLGICVPLPEPVRQWRTDGSSWAERVVQIRLKNWTIPAETPLMRHPDGRDVHQRARIRVGGKFFLAVGIVLLAMLGVTASGAVGLARLQSQIDLLYSDNIVTSQATTGLELALGDVEKVALQQVATVDPTRQAVLDRDLDEDLVPEVDRQLSAVSDLISDDPHGAERVKSISDDFDSYLSLRRAGSYSPGAGNEASEQGVAERTATLFGRMTAVAETLRGVEVREAEEADAAAESTYHSTLLMLIGGSAASLLVGLTVVLLLIRSLVPRIRSYSQFAGQIAGGRTTDLMSVRGNDELTDLGNALNAMVDARERLTSYESAQTEFIETLQATATEEEAHSLLKRHIERSLPDSGVTVLTRNNSNNRLEAATVPVEGDPLTARLVGAEPRACLALRMGRTHREGEDSQLLECSVCQHGAAVRSTCEPLLVSGEVIGSVLVNHDDQLAPQQEGRIALTVAQAAPVLANLRNLALAEFRANNDSLTGLPNKRATEDTFKRMIAQAHRSVAPLAVIMLDLDHFKKVNDQFGHGKGDEVLAAVGAGIQAVLRESDFAGRFGGEEFLILLPDTGVEGAARLAERLRESIAEITVAGIEREITASLGLAELLEHGGTPRGLLREADRALYAAKAAGRNRSVVARVNDSGDVVHTEVAVAVTVTDTLTSTSTDDSTDAALLS
jgi:diguanylate cyclase (GGDEF)-like protein